MPVPMDEYPIHQSPLSMEYVGTGDRNFYDRCYFAGHDRTGDILLITGLGVYPNLGVNDAYATVRRGDRQWAVRFSDALGTDRLNQRVGPYRIEVIEPLQTDPARSATATSTESASTSPGTARSRRFTRQQHVSRNGPRLFLDAPASRSSAPGRASCASTARDRRRPRRLDRGAGPVLGPAPGRGAGAAGPARGAGSQGFWWAVQPAAVRRLRHRLAGPGGAGRLPHHERRRADLG